MIKKNLISIILLFFAFNLYSLEIPPTAELHIYYSGVVWTSMQQETDLSEEREEIEEMEKIEEIEEMGNISSYINKSFLELLAALGFSAILDASDSTEIIYSVSPEITEFDLVESETSGFFLKASIFFVIENHSNNTTRVHTVSTIGWGNTGSEAIANTLDNIVSQFGDVIALFEEMSDTFRIIDIYQGTVVINAGRGKRIRTGDFLYSYDYHTGIRTGNFIIERTDGNLSYAKILDIKKKPETGDPVKSYNYIGILSKTYVNYFSGIEFSGYLAGTMVLWTRGLYSFNPLLGLNVLNLTNSNDSKVVLITPYLGFRIVRHIKSFSFSSVVSLGRGYLSESEIYGADPGWEYFGGTVKAEAEKRIMKHFSIHLEAGFTGWFSSDFQNYPDITGFTFGGGIGLKF